MDYLEEAAAELVKARAANGLRAAEAARLREDGRTDQADIIDAEVVGRRMEIAQCFTALAAIKAGVGKVTMEYPVPGTAEDPKE